MRHTEPYDYQYRFEVIPYFFGKRLIEFYCERFAFLSESEWRQVIAAGDVTVNYEPADPDQLLKAGDIVRTLRRGVQEPDVNDDYEILHDQDGILAINKPAPLAVHPSGRFFRNTLLHILREQFPERNFHPLHRLDVWTTGCQLLATDTCIAGQLHQQFDLGNVKKKYGVLAHGNFGQSPFTIDRPIGRLPQGIRGCGELASQAKEAVTHFTPLLNKNGITLLEAVPVTGRTNQIRVHIKEAGGSILNDPWYGQPSTKQNTQNAGDSIPFLGLHCRSMMIHHPSGKIFEFVAPWPKHFADFMAEPDPQNA